jgi:hypothetical protein
VRNYFQMIRWMRPAGSAALDLFCEMYLEPIFGKPDTHGNYIKIINNNDGSAPNLCFTAHSDTVHDEGGIQDLEADGNWLFARGSDCLGADCTTGVWLILEMIHCGVPGVYVIHAEEEIGCVGSRHLVKDKPKWLDDIDAVISFDRKGNDSIVTHQLGIRTCSDAFAKSFALAIDMPMKPDSGGVYTDSNEYIDIVGECTNISVGYLAQHTASECQDMEFLVELRDKLVDADWSKLVFSRQPMDPTEYEYDYMGYRSKFDTRYYDGTDKEQDLILTLVYDHPEEIATYLYNLGFSADTIAEELGVDSNKYLSKFLEEDLRERRIG